MAPVGVATKVLDVLGTFRARSPALTLTEIAGRSGLPLTTAHRIVSELAATGALERGADGRWRVGLRVWEIGALAPRGHGLREAALPFLEDLWAATHQNVQLAVLDGHDAVYVERLAARGAVNVVTRPGSRLPLHATGVGLVLLAHTDPALQEAVMAGPLPVYTAQTIRRPEELRRALADVRREGVAVAVAQIEDVSQSIAAPVRDARGTVVAALSVVVPVADDPRAYVPAVRTAAGGISRALG